MINEQKVSWLLEYALKLHEQFKSVSSKLQDDYSEDRFKIFFHKDRLCTFLQGHDYKITPITFELWPSLSCDARCPLCTYSLNNARQEADQSAKLFLSDVDNYIRILGQFKEAGVNSVIITGGGEPLLNPRLLELTTRVKAMQFSWGMFTHGMLLTENTIHGLLSSSPRFIRISINAGSSLGHNREYRIGKHTYDLVRSKAILASTISQSYSKSIGLGYALNGGISDPDLSGIREFIIDIMEKSKGGLASVAFRPKVIYYSPSGQPTAKQPRADLLPELVRKIDEFITAPLHAMYGNELKIDFKKGMFMRLYKSGIPRNSLATGWAGSIDEKGRGYILSELNGSPWPNSQIGDFSRDTFANVWYGNKRKSIVEKYAKGEILAPAHHKLSHVDETLREIRNSVGILNEDETNSFFEKLDSHQLVKPKNWDFL